MRFLTCIFLPLILTACSNKSSGQYADIPNLDFECSFLDADGCNTDNVNKPIFVGLDDNIQANCRDKMSTLNHDQLTLNFSYSAWTLTNTNGSILIGIFTHWVNYAQAPIINIPKQTYKVCSFIDLNESGHIDTQEPIGESLLIMDENDFLPISNWSNY